MRRDHRRFLALFLTLFGMALASSAHAGSLCAVGESGSAVCELVSSDSVPAGVDRDFLYDTSPPPLAPGAAAADLAQGGIMLAGQSSLAEPAPESGLLFGRIWSRVQHHDADLTSAR